MNTKRILRTEYLNRSYYGLCILYFNFIFCRKMMKENKNVKQNLSVASNIDRNLENSRILYRK